MKKLFLFLSLLVVNCGILFAEEIAITTYYPSPHGSYDELTANQMKIGTTYSAAATAFEDDGLLVEGDVGIGTTGPEYKLDVRGDRIQLRENSTGHTIAMRTDGEATDLTSSGADLYITADTNNDVLLNPRNTGNVGIGTINPGSKLVVTGLGATNATSALNVTNSAGTSALLVRDDGNVGIGTISPAISWSNRSLVVQDAGRATLGVRGPAMATLSLAAKNNNNWTVNTSIWNIDTLTDGRLLFSYPGTTTVTFGGRNEGGNVGIGTTTPQARLDVQGGTIRGRFNCRQVGGVPAGTASWANCPAGTWLLTGGGDCQYPWSHFIHYSRPVWATQSWAVDCYGVPGATPVQDGQAYATAICCDG